MADFVTVASYLSYLPKFKTEALLVILLYLMNITIFRNTGNLCVENIFGVI